MLGRALRETGAAMKEYGRSEVCLHSTSVCDTFVGTTNFPSHFYFFWCIYEISVIPSQKDLHASPSSDGIQWTNPLSNER
jgi:hypothetical protein